MESSTGEEDAEHAAIQELEPKTPRIERAKNNANKLLKIHTPAIGFRVLNVSGGEFEEEKDYKALYEAKVKEIRDEQEFLMVEEVTKLQESIELLQADNGEMKKKLSDQSAEMNALMSSAKERDGDKVKLIRQLETMQSRLGGTEMQFEQYKQTQERREKELLERLAENGAEDLQNIRKSLASIENEKKKLEVLLDEQAQARAEEMKSNESIINGLKEEITHSEKMKHQIEQSLQQKIKDLEENAKNSEKISQLETQLTDMKEMILVLEKTINTLESEKQELSVRISETTNIVADSEITMNETQVPEHNLSLMEMDNTLLCELVGKNFPSESPQTQMTQLAVIIEELIKEKTNLIDENEQLSGKVLESVQDCDNQRMKYEEMLGNENVKIKALRETLKQQKAEYQTLFDQLKEHEAYVTVLQKDKDKINGDLASLKQSWNIQKAELDKKIEFQTEKATRCDEKIMELNTTISNLVLKNERLDEQLQIAASQATNNIDINSDFKALQDKYFALLKESDLNKRLVSEMEARQEKDKMQIASLLNETGFLNDKISSDYLLLQEKDDTITEQRQQITGLEQKNKTFADQEKSYKQHLMKLDHENKSFEAEISFLKTSIHDIEANANDRIKVYVARFSEWQNLIQSNNKKMEEMVKENGKLPELVAQSRENVKIVWELRQQIADFNTKNDEFNAERRQLKLTLDSFEKHCEQLKKENAYLIAESERSSKESYLIHRATIDRQDLDLQKLTDELQERNVELQLLKTQIQQLQDEEQETMKSIEEMRDQHLNQVCELKGKISAEEAEKHRLQVEKDKLDDCNKELRRVTLDLRAVLEDLNAQLAVKDASINSSKMSQKKLEEELDNLREIHRREMESHKTDLTQMDRLKELVSKKKEAINQLSFTNKNLQSKCNELEPQAEYHLTELESLRGRVSHLCSIQDEIIKEKFELLAELHEKKCEVNNLMGQLKTLNTLKEQVQQIHAQNETLSAELKAVKDTAEMKQYEITDLNGKIHEKNTQIDDLQRELTVAHEAAHQTATTDELKVLEKENEEFIKQLKTMRSDYEKKLKNFRDANANLVQEREFLKTRLGVIDEKNSEIELLKDRVKKKEKTIDKLNGVVKEKMVEINELKVKRGDHRFGRDSVSPNGRDAEKDRRRSDRHSLHDVNRSISFEIEHEVGTMTDPTSEQCQCEELTRKIQKLQKELTGTQCELSSAMKDLKVNPLHNDVIMLQKDVCDKDQRIRSLMDEMSRVQQDLYQAKFEMRNTSSASRKTPSMNQVGCQTDEYRAMKNERFDDYKDQKENEAKKANTTETDYKAEYETLNLKYANLKRAYFKMRARQDEA